MEPMHELALRRQFDEAQHQALTDPAKAVIARRVLQAIIEGISESEVRAKVGQKTHSPKVDLAEERRAVVEANFRARGFEISVPKPNVSNTTLKRIRREGRELFYRPATSELGYAAWMSAHGQGKHWTVANKAERAKVGWEDATVGYWFTAEIAHSCPRLKMNWNDLTAMVKLLALEEYAVVYWTSRELTGERIDISTWCWLRTRFGRSALSADANDGEVWVNGSGPDDLSIPYDDGGGRAMEVVKNAA